MKFYLYYNTNGSVKFYTTEKHTDGQFIEITENQYLEAKYDIQVINGEIHERKHNFYLYYNADGSVKFYTMEKQPDGEFIIISAQQYAEGRYDVKVVDQKIRYKHTSSKLVQIDTDDAVSCDPTDITIVVSRDDPNLLWDIKHFYK